MRVEDYTTMVFINKMICVPRPTALMVLTAQLAGHGKVAILPIKFVKMVTQVVAVMEGVGIEDELVRKGSHATSRNGNVVGAIVGNIYPGMQEVNEDIDLPQTVMKYELVILVHPASTRTKTVAKPVANLVHPASTRAITVKPVAHLVLPGSTRTITDKLVAKIVQLVSLIMNMVNLGALHVVKVITRTRGGSLTANLVQVLGTLTKMGEHLARSVLQDGT